MALAYDVSADQLVPARRVRARTISIKRLSKRDLEAGRVERLEIEREDGVVQRPKTRGECLQGEHAERPCPFVSCKHHTYLEVSEKNGAIKLNFPHLEVWELEESCSLDVADQGGETLEAVGKYANVTRERVRQIETKTLRRMRDGPDKDKLQVLAKETE